MLVENFIKLNIKSKRELNLVKKYNLVGKIVDIIEYPFQRYLKKFKNLVIKSKNLEIQNYIIKVHMN